RPSWMDKSYATQLTLRPLSSGDSRVLARAVATDTLPVAVAETILQKAEGNPFFLEELTHAALEGGGASALPDTIQAVLAARIDRLAPGAKSVLQTAAVLGREFPSQLLEAVHDVPDVMTHLDQLVRREL